MRFLRKKAKLNRNLTTCLYIFRGKSDEGYQLVVGVTTTGDRSVLAWHDVIYKLWNQALENCYGSNIRSFTR
jgi:hypothetical protein